MSDYQFRVLCALGWCAILQSVDDPVMVWISVIFTAACSVGALMSAVSARKACSNDA